MADKLSTETILRIYEARNPKPDRKEKNETLILVIVTSLVWLAAVIVLFQVANGVS